MATGQLKVCSALSLAVLLVAYFYKQHSDEILKQHLNNVLSGLLRAESKINMPPEKKVAIGFGSCLDVISVGTHVLDKLNSTPPLVPEHYNEIEKMEELEKVFAYFFRHGAAAERYMSNGTLFKELVGAAKSLDETWYSLGGNAPVMANRFKKEGLDVLLATKMSSNLQKEILADIKVVGGDVQDDDIHLLLEYPTGETWGQYKSPRANRFIVHNDENNPTVSSLEAFSEEVKHFSPTLMVVGGLQMLDNFPFLPGQRKVRLEKLRDLLVDTPRETRIHFEMASFAEEDCLRDVIDAVLYSSDSLGMNEQELPNLLGFLTNGSITLLSDPYPRIATTLDQMRTLFRTIRSTQASDAKHRLTRLHVHTLAYQAIMTTKGSSWKNSMSAAAKASLVANRHTCGSSQIHIDKARILMDDSFTTSREEGGQRLPFKAERPVTCWEEEGEVEICIAPVLVCTDVVQTGGGGDNVSSAGLVFQI